MKILFIQPPLKKHATIGPPLGLGYLASNLKEFSNSVKIVDTIILKLNFQKIFKIIHTYDPDLLGISVSTQSIYDAISIANYAKQNNPNCKIVMGGPHPTIRDKDILNSYKSVDIIVRGEGERTILNLIRTINKKNKNNIDFIDGITFRKNKKIIRNKNRKYIKNLDNLNFPSYNLLPMDKYIINDKFFETGILGKQKQQYGTINSSRGCPFGCNFCSSFKLWGKKWRARSPENVIEELKILRYKYNKKIIDFVDDTFTLNIERTKKICNLIINEGIDISWLCTTRVDVFNEDLAKHLKKAGCNLVLFGLESGNQSSLDFLNKGYNIKTAEKAVKIAQKYDLKIRASFIIGIPNENKDDINNTISYAKKLNLSFSVFPILMPFPGTKIYDYSLRNGLLNEERWNHYNYYTPIVYHHSSLSKNNLKFLQIKAGIITNINLKNLKRIIKGFI